MTDKIYEIIEKLNNEALENEEVPVAAVITKNDEIISYSRNMRNGSNITIDHAEILAIKKANIMLKNWRLDECDMYVTHEPCEMCKNVIKESRIKNVYYFIEKPLQKKQYNNTNFILLINKKSEVFVKEYFKKTRNFWEKLRKK